MTNVTVKILLCRDGSKHDIQISQEATLSDLKAIIRTAPSITKRFHGQAVQPKYQRLFYFGRELKTPKRSLSALGLVSRRLPLLIHLHSTQPKVVNIDSSKSQKGNNEEDDEIEFEEVRYSGYKRPAVQAGMGMRMGMGMGIGANMAMGLGISSRTTAASSAVGIASAPSAASAPTNTATRTIQQDVVNLLDDSDDDDIEVIETRSGGRKRARRG